MVYKTKANTITYILEEFYHNLKMKPSQKSSDDFRYKKNSLYTDFVHTDVSSDHLLQYMETPPSH